MLDVIKEPTLPARIILMNVGANSSITDCRVAKPTKFFGISGFSILSAVCMDTTPPTKKDKKATIPKEPIIRSCISRKVVGWGVHEDLRRLHLALPALPHRRLSIIELSTLLAGPSSSMRGMGLAKAVLSLLGLYMDKTLQVSNWEQRPLSDEQQLYAICDAYVLLLLLCTVGMPEQQTCIRLCRDSELLQERLTTLNIEQLVTWFTFASEGKQYEPVVATQQPHLLSPLSPAHVQEALVDLRFQSTDLVSAEAGEGVVAKSIALMVARLGLVICVPF